MLLAGIEVAQETEDPKRYQGEPVEPREKRKVMAENL
jgi:hypothetical protein